MTYTKYGHVKCTVSSEWKHHQKGFRFWFTVISLKKTLEKTPVFFVLLSPVKTIVIQCDNMSKNVINIIFSKHLKYFAAIVTSVLKLRLITIMIISATTIRAFNNTEQTQNKGGK